MIAKSSFNPYKQLKRLEFSENELAIIRHICEELSNKEIAACMNLSKRTVEGYREKILEKLDAKNSVGIVVYAIKHKIIEYQN